MMSSGTRINSTDSSIKIAIDTWYENNLKTDYGKYLSTTAIYCNDRILASGQTYSTTNRFYYASYERLVTNKTPTYNCTNNKDAFSGNNNEAKLTYPIGLMTADEIAYAGEKYIADLTAPYAWYYTNANGESIIGGADSWFLSPYGWNGSIAFDWYWRGSYNPGSLSDRVITSFSVRPAVSLKSCIKYSTGNGSAGTPYTIEETSSGC